MNHISNGCKTFGSVGTMGASLALQSSPILLLFCSPTQPVPVPGCKSALAFLTMFHLNSDDARPSFALRFSCLPCKIIDNILKRNNKLSSIAFLSLESSAGYQRAIGNMK